MTFIPPIKAIVYDLDGTLLDTFPGLFSSLKCIAGPLHEFLDSPSLRLSLSAGIPAMIADAALQLRLQGDRRQAFATQVLQHYERHGLHTSLPYAGATNHLAALQERGIAQGLCTNRDRKTTLALLDRHGLKANFQHIVCLGELPHAKPHPAPLLHCLAMLQTTPASGLFVGDSRIDAECARLAEVGFMAHCRGYHGADTDLLPHVMAFSEWQELTRHLTRHIAFNEVVHV